MYSEMVLIRLFEDRVYDLFVNKEVPGTTHLCQGQEGVSVGVCSSLLSTDMITCTYRGHGHCLAKGIEPRRVMAEILGRSTGCCGGKGGSMHISDFEKGVLGSFAIVGAGLPVALGAGLSSKYLKNHRVTVAFFGDGAANIGSFHEALNFASIFKLPVIFVCENNLYGEYTHISRSTSVRNIADRAAAYGMDGIIVDGNDVQAVYWVSKKAVDNARAGLGPTLIECKTYRHKGHSRTDSGKYRPEEEVKMWHARDPLKLFSQYLVSNKITTAEELTRIQDEQRQIVEDAYKFAQASPWPDESELTTNVYA